MVILELWCKSCSCEPCILSIIECPHLLVVDESVYSWTLRYVRPLTVKVAIPIHVWERLEKFRTFAAMNIFRTNYPCGEKLSILLFLSRMIIQNSACHSRMNRLFERGWIIPVYLTFCFVWHDRLFYFAIVFLIASLCSYLARKVSIFRGLMSKLVFRLRSWNHLEFIYLTSWAWALHNYSTRCHYKWISEFRIRFGYHGWGFL